MPIFLIPWIVGALGGATVGSIVTSSVSHPAHTTPQEADMFSVSNAIKIGAWSLAGVAVIYAAKKAKVF